jgi:KDO2-lipid IV(A) lauroyltransferase
MKKNPWAKLKKRLKNWLIYRFIKFLIASLNLFPRKLSLFIGSNLGKFAYLILPEARQTIFKNLKTAFPYLDINTCKKISLKVFESLGQNSTDAVRLQKMSREEINKIVETEGMKHFDEAYRLGRGVMAVTGHIGNFELLAVYFSLRGYKVSVIGRELYDPRLNELLVQSRRKMEVETIPSSVGVKEVIKALNSGSALGVLIDQDSSRFRGIFVNFFGKPARTPVGPLILALRLGSPIVPMAIISTRKGNYKIIIREEILPLSEKSRDENIVYLTQKCTDFLEKIIREYPDQWVWVHERWRNAPDNT